MTLYSEAPELVSWPYVKPTLLVCWWATLFCTVIILLRVAGRFVRSETLFTEDKMAFYSLIPMYARMGCVHVILVYGTNNTDFSNVTLTAEELRRRTIGSGLVLASRIFYSATLWVLKNTILEFFKRLTGLTWSRTYSNGVLAIRCVLGATFVAILISDLAECQPFTHYWQVQPDPGGHCRQGYVNLLTTGVCNALTDLLLVLFPVPIIINSQMSLKRKIQLVLLFSLSLGVVAVSLYRVTHVIDAHGSQQLRSLLASIELLVATCVANALVLGSFVRDRGVKKRRFKYGSIAGESAHGTDSGNRSRRPTVAGRTWGSDEDLVRDLGFRVQKDLVGDDDPSATRPTPAGPVAPHKPFNMQNWNFPTSSSPRGPHSPPLQADQRSNAPSSSEPRRVSFFDVGGLLKDDSSPSLSPARRQSTMSSLEPSSPRSPRSPPVSAYPASASGFRRGSQTLLQDIGGLLTPFKSSKDQGTDGRGKDRWGSSSSGTELRDMSPAISPRTERPSDPPPYDRRDTRAGDPNHLMDVGGLLNK
ncbi:hypothetical protein VMCG_02560 [Cytospora schulzeri]|uniref:Rhodopsin domain-containing protein n=1 Tax=Cytospora schulzeri TaxID=448051 RepID=A0A423X0K1_9PEZI|nr:hypothetical protein VMCG_02560 [Valsa malicola]